MGYTPENNPYIPGDPYSYDLAWMVQEVKAAQQVGQQAQQYANAALQSQIEAQQAKDLSMAWAIGEDDGGPVPPGEPQYENNSKYYAQQAAGDALLIEHQLTEIPDIKDRLSNAEVDLAVLEGRVDTFASLPPGSTAGNAELLDIRVAADGQVYPSAGDAVRAQHLTVNNISNKRKVTKITPVINSGQFVNLSGTVGSSTSYYYFTIDNVQEADIIEIRSFYGNSTSVVIPYIRYVCAYDAGGTAQPASGGENIFGSFTVPSGITKIDVSILETYPLESVVLYRSGVVNDFIVNDNINSSSFGTEPASVSGTLQSGVSLEIDCNSVKKNKSIILTGNVSAFGSIKIGQGSTDLNSSFISIDGTNVVFNRSGVVNASDAHGLTFADYISVVVRVDEDHLATVTIMTNGGRFQKKYTSTWTGCLSNIYASTEDTTVLTDAVLSFACTDISQPLWIFGDSYVSFTLDRWPYWAKQLGITEYLLNGYSGETSAYAVKDLRNLLIYGTPKYIVWAMGMNDADRPAETNPVWKMCVNEVAALCNGLNITLILCTIPNTPTRNNIFKNAEIQGSGAQYIDFASAVGAFNDTTWYPGMLSGDNTHPTQQGAQALLSAILKDFPYIFIK